MLKPHGYLMEIGEGLPREWDTSQCAHCNRHVIVRAGRQLEADQTMHQIPLGWCGRCGAVICAACEARGVCVPFETQLAQLEARGRFLRQVEEMGRR